jgi:hypothetical protein
MVKRISGISKKLVKEYNAALEELSDNHGYAAYGHDYVRNGVRHEVVDSYVLDTFGNRYMATHFPEFPHSPSIRPFADAAEELRYKTESEACRKGVELNDKE